MTEPESSNFDDEPQDSRRHLLRLAAAAVAGGAVAGLLTSEEAAAATGGPLLLGNVNSATGTDGTTLNAAGTFGFSVFSSAFGGYAITADIQKAGTALAATVNNSEDGAVAVDAQVSSSSLGYAIRASGGTAQMKFQRNAGTGFVTKPDFSGGELFANITGLYYAVSNGGTVDSVWHTLASQDAAGAFYPISPTRVFDSRVVAPVAPLLSGANRTVSVANGIAPAVADVVRKGARAIAYNLTVTGTVGGFGFLAVNEGGNTSAATSAINWTASAQTLANASVVKLNDNREITVVCGGPGASTHFIIDVVGFYH